MRRQQVVVQLAGPLSALVLLLLMVPSCLRPRKVLGGWCCCHPS